MRENQNVEFKRLWKDEYLEWICGYANAEGGKLYIGIDDEGTCSAFRMPLNSWLIFPTKSGTPLALL